MKHTDFIQLTDLFKDKCFRLAKRLLISREEAEDAVQEILLRLWNKKDNLGNYTSVEALAITMTKNYCLDQLKSKRTDNLQLVHSNYTDNSVGTVRETESRNDTEWAFHFIRKLPEQQRIIIQLRDIEEYEFEQIAEILEMSETAVRTALSRARKIIREQLTAVYNYGIKAN